MASKAGRLAKGAKKGKSAIFSPFLKLNIPAGLAKPAPPLGPQLGQRGINMPQFCKEFNTKTGHIKEGYPIPTAIEIRPDKTFSITMHTPATSYLLRKAAGASKGAMNPGKETAGILTVKHVYELAQIKKEDPSFDGMDLKQICNLIIGQSHSLGIKIVKDISLEELTEFHENRKLEIEEQNKEIEEKKAAKMLRL